MNTCETEPRGLSTTLTRAIYRQHFGRQSPAALVIAIREAHQSMMARVVQLAATKRGRIAWRIMPNPNRVDAMTDAQVLTLINGPGDSRNLRKRMLRLWSNNGVSIAAPPGCDAHHLIPIEASAAHRRFLAKIGFDIDHPKNGTFLPNSQIYGPRAIGQSQAVHTGSHPGYSAALTAKVNEIGLSFTDKIDGIVGTPGSSEYETAYQNVVQAHRSRIDAVQVKCRDNLQKGLEIVGDTDQVNKQWTTLLGGI